MCSLQIDFQICLPDDDLKWPVPSLQISAPLKGEWDTQRPLGVLSAILSFFDVERMLLLIYWLGSPINKAIIKAIVSFFFFLAGLQHGIIHTGDPYSLPLNITTLPQKLKKAGKAKILWPPSFPRSFVLNSALCLNFLNPHPILYNKEDWERDHILSFYVFDQSLIKRFLCFRLTQIAGLILHNQPALMWYPVKQYRDIIKKRHGNQETFGVKIFGSCFGRTGENGGKFHVLQERSS